MSEVSNETPAVEPAQSNPGLQITDLIAVVQLITAVTQRGAIQAGELSQVGGLYDRLVAFLEANGAIKRGQNPDVQPAAAEETAQ
jgi:hypothetical protein